MTLKNKNPWKYLSVGLLGVIAIGLLAPVQAAPGGVQNGWQIAVAGLQTQVDAAVGDFQGQIDALVADLATEASDRAAADTAEESRATAAEAGIASDLADHEAADGDLDSTNEIQNLSETNGVISLSDDGSVTVQDRVSGTCAIGSSIRAINADGTVTCEDGTDTTYDGYDFVLSNQLCPAGKVVTGVTPNGFVNCLTDANTGFPSIYTKSGSKTITGLTSGSVEAFCSAGDRMLNWQITGGTTSNRIVAVDLIHDATKSGVGIDMFNGSTASQSYTTLVTCLDL